MPTRPQSPFPGVQPTMVSPDLGVYSWLCKPGAMVNRFATGIYATGAMASFVTVDVHAAMRLAFPDVQKYIFVHDFSGVTGYDSSARQTFTRWGKETTSEGIVEAVWLIPPALNPIVKMGVSTGLATLRAFGQNIQMTQDLAALIAKLELTPS